MFHIVGVSLDEIIKYDQPAITHFCRRIFFSHRESCTATRSAPIPAIRTDFIYIASRRGNNIPIPILPLPAQVSNHIELA